MLCFLRSFSYILFTGILNKFSTFIEHLKEEFMPRKIAKNA